MSEPETERPEEAPRAPVLVAREARIAVDDVLMLEGFTLSTEGDWVLCAGEVAPLFAAISGVPLAARGGSLPDPELEDTPAGEAHVVGGELLLAGHRVEKLEHLELMGAAPLDPPLPAAWTAEEYVAWSARLAGVSRRAAREMARAVLDRVGLHAARGRKLDSLALPERRVLALAQASVTSPEVLVLDSPLAGLEGTAAVYVQRALAAVSEGRRVLLSVSRLEPGTAEGALARGAHWLVVLSRGELALSGAPAELFAGASLVRVCVRSGAEALRAELAARGIELLGGPVHFSARLPEGASTRDLVAAAQAARAPLLEMVPLFG